MSHIDWLCLRPGDPLRLCCRAGEPFRDVDASLPKTSSRARSSKSSSSARSKEVTARVCSREVIVDCGRGCSCDCARDCSVGSPLICRSPSQLAGGMLRGRRFCGLYRRLVSLIWRRMTSARLTSERVSDGRGNGCSGVGPIVSPSMRSSGARGGHFQGTQNCETHTHKAAARLHARLN